MAATQNSKATTEDVEAQIEQIQKDISTLTRLITEVAGAKAENTKDIALDQAADLIARTKKNAESVKHRAEGAAHSLEHYIEEKPVQSAMIALLAGLVVGWWSRR